VSRSAVYAAEDQWSAVLDRGGVVDFFGSRLDVPAQRRFGDLASVRAYAEAVLALRGVVDAYPATGPVLVRERRGQTKAHYESQDHTIAVPLQSLWAAREAVVLHELAHHVAWCAGLCSAGADWHGPAYRRVMCDLVAIVLGDTAALLLRAGYEELGVPPAAVA
jgi:putative metallohydrolase (TIGR04338 family)